MRFHRADGQSATLTQHSHRIFMQSKPRTPHRARWRLLASLAIPVLASCGGGSSDTPAPPPPPPPRRGGPAALAGNPCACTLGGGSEQPPPPPPPARHSPVLVGR